MRFLSVCSGIEAASVAWEPLGWTPLAFSEIEPFPRAVLAHRFPDVPLHGDFTALRNEPWIVDADGLVGGTPCQGFSVAGQRGSLDDDRSNLALEFIRLADAIDDLRLAAGRPPVWVVWENVPGVLSTHDNAFGAFLGGLVGGDAPIEPRGGWKGAGVVDGPRRVAAWRVLDAQHFGLAQRRKRVFVLALGGVGRWAAADALLPVRDSLSGNPPPGREAGERVAPTIGVGAPYGRTGNERVEVDALIHAPAVSPTLRAGGNRTGGDRPPGTDVDTCDGLIVHAPEISPALKARDHKGVSSDGDGDGDGAPLVVHTLRGDGFDASEDGTGRGTPLVPVYPTLRAGQSRNNSNAATEAEMLIAFDCKASGWNGFGAGDVSPTLRAMGHASSHQNAGGQVAVAIQERAVSENPNAGPQGSGISEDLAFTIESRQTPQAVASSMAVRRITPREAERLQGFPDGWTAIPWRGKPASECPDGPRYKALGNSMAVPVIRWLGQRIQAVTKAARAGSEAAA